MWKPYAQHPNTNFNDAEKCHIRLLDKKTLGKSQRGISLCNTESEFTYPFSYITQWGINPGQYWCPVCAEIACYRLVIKNLSELGIY